MRILGHFGKEKYPQRHDIVQESLWISGHFGTGYYGWRLDIVQNLYQLWWIFFFDLLDPK